MRTRWSLLSVLPTLLALLVLAGCAPAPGTSADPPVVAAASFAADRPTTLDLEARAAAAGVVVIDEDAPLSLHLHAELQLTVDGEAVTVPAGVGVDETSGRMAELHTHDTSNQIHVESNDQAGTYTVGQFLALWGAGSTPDAVCEAFTGSSTCGVEVRTVPASSGNGLATSFIDGTTVTVTITSR